MPGHTGIWWEKFLVLAGYGPEGSEQGEFERFATTSRISGHFCDRFETKPSLKIWRVLI
jgi:hypothetical protein